MNRVGLFVTSAALSLAALPALAQQSTGNNAGPDGGPPPWAFHHSWGWDGGYGGHFGFFHPFLFLLAVIGFVALVRRLAWGGYGGGYWGRRCGYARRPHYWGGYGPGPDGGGHALSILEERFAKGEIDKATFEDMRKSLGR
jgi:putative membrane protein